MAYINKHRFTQESRLERWLGRESFEHLQRCAVGLKTPTPVAFMPEGEAVYAVEGLFYGAIRGGGFASLSDLISERTSGGKGQDRMFSKVGTTGVANFSNSLWRVGNVPAAAGAAGALAGGTHNNNTTAGGLGQADPSGSDTLHLTTVTAWGTVAPNTLLLYDRLWNGLITLSSSSTQTCTLTGYPDSTGRYSAYSGSNSSQGNFAFVANEAGATLSAVAHTWTMVYTDDAGNTGQTAAAINGISGAITNRVDHAEWYITLLSGDYGVADIESIACNVATLAAGSPTIVLAHPLMIIPILVANAPVIVDGINSAFNLVEVKTDACLALMELNRNATTATTYGGLVTMVSG